MLKPKFICVVLLSTLLLACGTNEEEKNTVERVNVDDFQVYPIDINADRIPMTQVIESIEFLRLEETDQSLLSVIRDVKKVNDRFYLLGENELFIFDAQGNFLENFSKMGEGPKEHGLLTGFWVRNKELFLYGPNHVYHYDANRNHVKTYRLDFHNMALAPLPNGYLGNTEGFGRDTTFYRLTQYNDNFEPEAYLGAYRSHRADFNISFGSTLKSYNDGMVFIPSKNDTMFWYKNGEVQPFMKIDVGSDFFWEEGWDLKPFEEVYEDMSDEIDPKVVDIKFSLNERLVHLRLYIGSGNYSRFLIDRITGNQIRLEIDSKWGSWRFHDFYEDGTGLVSFSSDEITPLISVLEEGQYQFGEGTDLEVIESSENQVLAWVKFKKTN